MSQCWFFFGADANKSEQLVLECVNLSARGSPG